MTTHFRELDVWRLSMDLAGLVYQLTATFPREERFGLSAQMQRAAVSIPSNIAEGNARQSRRQYAHFISIASGSNAELQTQLQLAVDLRIATEASVTPVLAVTERIGQMLYRLQQSLVAQAGSRVPGPGSRVREDHAEYR